MKRAITCLVSSGLAVCACASEAEYVDAVVVDQTSAQYVVELTTERGMDGRGKSFSRATFTVADFQQSELPHVESVEGCTRIDLRDFDGYPLWSATTGELTLFSEHSETVVMKPIPKEPGLFLVDGLPLYAKRMPEWQPREKISLLAEGDVIPRFWATLRYPEPIVLEGSETRAANTKTVLDKSKDVAIEWAATNDQEVGLLLVQYRRGFPGRVDYRIECFFPGSAGKGVIAAAVMADLNTSDLGDDGRSRTELYAVGQSRSSIKNGVYQIFVSHRIGDGHLVDVE